MDQIIQNWKSLAKTQYQETLAFLKSIKGKKNVDQIAAQLDTEVFSKVDCLACANCCKTTPALVTPPDANRIAKHLGMTPKAFTKNYLLEDINGEMMFNHVPCTFLNEDHTCQIYEVRPNACREYPHTAQNGFHRRSTMNAKNTVICPAAFEIVERLKGIA